MVLSNLQFGYRACIMLGIAGSEGSRAHAEETAKLLNKFKPVIIAPLTTSIDPNSTLARMVEEGSYAKPSEVKILEEELYLLKLLDMRPDCYLLGNHVYNSVPMSGYFKDKICG